MRRYQVYDQPKLTTKDSFGLRADWRMTRNSTPTLSWQIGYTTASQIKYNISWDASQTLVQRLDVRNGGLVPGINNKTDLMNLWQTNPNPEINPDAYKYFRQWGYDEENYGGYYIISPNGGQAKIKHNAGATDKYGLTNVINLTYRYTGSEWTFDLGLNGSIAKSWQRDMQNGHFSNVLTKIAGNVDRVLIGGIQKQDAPTIRQGYNADGTIMDITNLTNFSIDTVTTSPSDSKDTFKTIQANLQRNLNWLPFHATLKTGGEIRTQERDTVKDKISWGWAPGNDNPLKAQPFVDAPYYTRTQAWGLPNLEFPSPYLLYQEFLASTAANPGDTPKADPGTPWPNGSTFQYYTTEFNPPEKTNSNYYKYQEYRFANNYYIEETVTAFYVQFDTRFLDNRLSITTGFRYEMTTDRGLSAEMPDYKIEDPYNPGTLLTSDQLNSTGAYIQNSGSIKDEYNRLMGDFIAENWIIRGKKFYKTYADIYPSLHANYNITPNMIARLAYARTLGRPDFSNIVPMARYNEGTTEDGDSYVRIKTSNPALKPYCANNLDLALEYYFNNGGIISANAFYKSIKNPFGQMTIAATPQMLAEMGISNTFANPILVTPVNLDGRLEAKGVELNVRAPLSFIPRVGRYLSITANGTVMDISAPYNANLEGFVKQSASWGVNVITPRLTLRLNWNYRGRQKLNALTDVQYQAQGKEQSPLPEDFQGFYEYVAPRLTLDASLEYSVTKSINFFMNARNLTNSRMVWERYNDLTPDYAKTYYTEQYGIQVAFGIKGKF